MKFIFKKIKKRVISVAISRNKYFNNEYSKVKRLKPTIKTSGNIIVAPFTFDNTHAFEAIYSRKAILEGKNVYAFLCGQGVKYCEKKGHSAKNNYIRCEICNQMQNDFVDQIGVKPFFVFSNILMDEELRISKYIKNNKNKLTNLDEFMNIDINKILISALQRHYLEAEPKIESNPTTIGFLNTILRTLVTFDKLCKETHPEYVLVSHGTYSSWGSIVEYCKKNNVRVIVWGRMYNKYGIYFSEGESYLTESVNGSNDFWESKKLSEREQIIIKDFLDMRTGYESKDFLYDYNKNQKKQLSEKEIRDTYNISEDKIIVGMFPNIPWDGSVSGVSETFSSYREWLFTTIKFFKDHKRYYLLIRTHPAEVAPDAEIGRETLKSLIEEMDIELPDNVIIIPPNSKINSFALGKVSMFGIFYCSTVGMELTYLNVPLVCAGPSPLRNKGIVYDAKDKGDYIRLLREGLNNKLLVDEIKKENLVKFSYYYMFSRVMPETLIKFHGPILKNLTFDTEEDLKNNPVLDYLFNGIENKDTYLFDQFHIDE